MPFICKICEKCPTSHSLVTLDETEEQNIYYTCPSSATNNNTAGIVAHYDGILGELNGKKWIWVLDLKGFKMKNYLEIGNGIALSKLITEKYSEHLQKIIVVNPNMYTSAIFNMVKPFLSERVQNLVVFSNQPFQKIQRSMPESNVSSLSF
jgi:hypothetical protein